MDYRVELDDYSGPLDLLLYLIKGEEVDIYDIPIALIADRYVECLGDTSTIDINSVAEFLLMASRLMEMKSRKLTRKPESEDDEAEEEGDQEDPSAELFRQLLALRAFKEAATLLCELADIRSRQYSRGGRIELPDEEEDEGPQPVEGISLFELAERYSSIMRQTGGGGGATIERDRVTVQERTEAIIGALSERPDMALQALFEESDSRVMVVGTFFVLLELVWRGEVRVYQNEDYGRIFVKRRAEEGAEGEGEEEGDLPPAMPHVEPHLPPPVVRRIGPDGKPIRIASRTRFGGLDRADEQSVLSDDDFIAADNFEVRLKARIERILKLADEICERFEQSLRSRAQPVPAEGAPGGDGASAASASLDAELAAFQDELGPEEADGPDAAEGSGDAQADGAGSDIDAESDVTEPDDAESGEKPLGELAEELAEDDGSGVDPSVDA
ncbi:MAG: segregation and condensation protein A [Planctomycetota bacterium]